MKYDNGNPPHLLWNKNVYSDFGIISVNNVIGKQIGTIKGLKYSEVFEVKNQSPQSWLIVADTYEMTIYTLYKENSVTNIPTNLEKYKR